MVLVRSINNVLAFSRETLVAVIANIESREWRRIDNIRKPEHPRASTMSSAFSVSCVRASEKISLLNRSKLELVLSSHDWTIFLSYVKSYTFLRGATS